MSIPPLLANHIGNACVFSLYPIFEWLQGEAGLNNRPLVTDCGNGGTERADPPREGVCPFWFQRFRF